LDVKARMPEKARQAGLPLRLGGPWAEFLEFILRWELKGNGWQGTRHIRQVIQGNLSEK